MTATTDTTGTGLLRPHAEQVYAAELAALAAADDLPRPPSWRLSPRAVVTYLLGVRAQQPGARGVCADGQRISSRKARRSAIVSAAERSSGDQVCGWASASRASSAA